MTTNKLFGTDGIRGRVGSEAITPEFAVKLARAIARQLPELTTTGRPQKVVIAYDTRQSAAMLVNALTAGFCAEAIAVIDAGVLTTPALAWAVTHANAALGLMITASHNPWYDNGYKLFDHRGEKLTSAQLLAIETALTSAHSAPSTQQTVAVTHRDGGYADGYLKFCQQQLPPPRQPYCQKIVLDCAHGAGHQLFPQLLSAYAGQVIAIGDQPDGVNINDHYGATAMTHLQNAVREHQADLGLALDGDGDRLLAVSADGRLVDGDQLLLLLALTRANIPGLVGTVMTNMAVENVLSRHNLPLIRTPVGDQHIYRALVDQDWPLGGESSGHIILRDYHSTGDGMLAALAVLQALSQQNCTLAEWVQRWPLWPTYLKNLTLHDWPTHHFSSAAVQEAIAQAEGQLHQHHGRLVVRLSGTEPLVRLYGEAPDKAALTTIVDDLAQRITP